MLRTADTYFIDIELQDEARIKRMSLNREQEGRNLILNPWSPELKGQGCAQTGNSMLCTTNLDWLLVARHGQEFLITTKQMKFLVWGGYTQIKYLFWGDLSLHLTVWAVIGPHMSSCTYLGCSFQVPLQLLCKQNRFRKYFSGDVSNFELSQQSQLMPRVWHTLGTGWPCDRVPGTWLTHAGHVMGTWGAQHTRASEETKLGRTTRTAEMRGAEGKTPPQQIISNTDLS